MRRRLQSVRLLFIGVVIAAACAAPGLATAGSGLKVSFLGQPQPRAGSAWAFYLQVRKNNRPWKGTATIDVQTPKGRVIDRVGRYPINGSLLAGYLWNPKDHGLLIFKIVLTQNGRTVAQTTYPVRVV